MTVEEIRHREHSDRVSAALERLDEARSQVNAAVRQRRPLEVVIRLGGVIRAAAEAQDAANRWLAEPRDPTKAES